MSGYVENIYNNLTRNGDMNEIIYEKNIQKKNFEKYNNTNHFGGNNKMKDVINLATGQPNVFFNGPNNNIDSVDEESSLLIGSLQTKSKCKLNLQTRKYVTVPYLADKKSVKDILVERTFQNGSKWKYPTFKFRSFMKEKKRRQKMEAKKYGEEKEDKMTDDQNVRFFKSDRPMKNIKENRSLELKLLRGQKEC